MATTIPVTYTTNHLGASPQDFVWTDADASGHLVPNSQGNVAIWINNGRNDDVTMTVTSPVRSEMGELVERTFVFPKGLATQSPQFDRRRFTNPSTGMLSFTLSAVGNVQVAAVVIEKIFKES
jgi:hypothetical protein